MTRDGIALSCISVSMNILTDIVNGLSIFKNHVEMIRKNNYRSDKYYELDAKKIMHNLSFFVFYYKN